MNRHAPHGPFWRAAFMALFPFLALAPTNSHAQTTHTISWGFDTSGASISVEQGDTVRWEWDQNPQAHSVTSGTSPTPDGQFNSGVVGSGSSFEFTFNTQGMFAYFCMPHPGMQGTITVTEPLPVELTAFEAFADGADVVFRWETASETNNAGFQLEHRAATAAAFGLVDFVEGRGTTSTPQRYRHRLAGFGPGRHIFRLKQLDFDGTFAYSPEVAVEVVLPGTYTLSAVYPNPFNPRAQLSLTLAAPQSVAIRVFDMRGQQVATLHDGPLAADRVYPFALEAGAWPSGLYLIRVVGADFVDERRAMLVK